VTRIDFHFNVPDRLTRACRIVGKAWRAGCTVLVWSDDEERLAAFDHLLWSEPRAAFIPHVRMHDPLAAQTPVLLSHESTDAPTPDVLVNLGERTPPQFARFERVIEIVGLDEQERAAARERWRLYRDHGYPMTRHDAGGAGPA